MMAGRPDPALQDLQSDTRLKTHQMIVDSFRILLGLAAEFSWDKYIQGQREKYEHPEDLPKEAEKEILAKYSKHQQIKTLINGDSQAGQAPRFLLVDSAGSEIYRSTPILNVS